MTRFKLLLAACLLVMALSASVAPAQAAFGVSMFDGGTFGAPPPGTTDPLVSGPAFTQAGGHPYDAWTAFQLNRTTDAGGFFAADGGNARNVTVDLPPGLVGNPTAVPQCPGTRRIALGVDDFVAHGASDFCGAESVVGIALITQADDPGLVATLPVPVFSLEPPPGSAAGFAFQLLTVPAFLDAKLRGDGEYAISVRSRDIPSPVRVLGVRVILWGNPSDPAHDTQRCVFFPGAALEFGFHPTCSNNEFFFPPGETPAELLPTPFPADLPRKAFITLPTACTPPGVGLVTRIHLDPWDPAVASADSSFVSHLPPHDPAPQASWGPPQGPTGCDQVPFDPSFSAVPDSSAPDSPTGLTVQLGFPQEGLEDPEGIATAHLRDATVTLPEGMTINPSAAGGLTACTDAQVGFGSVSPDECPDAAKIATVTATTPLLDEELTGSVYIGSQLSDDPESGDMFRIVLVLENEARGIYVKLLGKVRADRNTGRLVTSFEGNPQVPVSELTLRFKAGPRAPLAMPSDCGTKVIDAQLTSWAGHAVERSSAFTVDCPGANGFAPAFSAGTVNATGGAFSPFAVRIERPDRQQYMSGLTVELPPGLLGKLKGVPRCPDAQASAGTCGAESRVGTATVGAGTGADPFFLRGAVSLTGPYKGAPFGLSVAVPAVAGPFNLGTVVVRQALFVDPVDAHVTVVSDPLPQIVKGVPVRLRSINVDVDRPGFTLNPTSCAEKHVRAVMSSAQGATHRVAQRFQVAGCPALPLRPRLALRLTGKRQTTDGRHPGLRAVLTQADGQANLKRVAVRLPLSLALDPDNAQELCEFEAGQRVDCPASSIIGSARAFTPVLDEPLTGPVYFVKNVRVDAKTGRQIRTLPTLLIPLRGEVAIDLRATSSVKRGKLVNTFPAIPDAPVSRFELNLKGGKGGILVVTNDKSLCRGRHVARLEMDGHNGKRRDTAVRMKTPCAAAKKSRTRGRR